ELRSQGLGSSRHCSAKPENPRRWLVLLPRPPISQFDLFRPARLRRKDKDLLFGAAGTQLPRTLGSLLCQTQDIPFAANNGPGKSRPQLRGKPHNKLSTDRQLDGRPVLALRQYERVRVRMGRHSRNSKQLNNNDGPGEKTADKPRPFHLFDAGRIGIGSGYRFNMTGLKQQTHNKREDSSNDRRPEKRRCNSARRSAAALKRFGLCAGAIASGERADAEDPLAAGGGLSISRASRAAVDPGADRRVAAQA